MMELIKNERRMF